VCSSCAYTQRLLHVVKRALPIYNEKRPMYTQRIHQFPQIRVLVMNLHTQGA